MVLFGSSEEKEIKSDGIVTNNLIVENELKTTDDDLHMWIKNLVIVQVIILAIMAIKMIMKHAKRTAQRENILLNEVRARQG